MLYYADTPMMTKTIANKFKPYYISVNNRSWHMVKEVKMMTVLLHKFLSSMGLYTKLKDETCRFVEASPYDHYWGIGFSAETADANRDNWGLNRLGVLLKGLHMFVNYEQENLGFALLWAEIKHTHVCAQNPCPCQYH
jgi:ribA/ribD-fused uncharacterized protein